MSKISIGARVKIGLAIICVCVFALAIQILSTQVSIMSSKNRASVTAAVFADTLRMVEFLALERSPSNNLLAAEAAADAPALAKLQQARKATDDLIQKVSIGLTSLGGEPAMKETLATLTKGAHQRSGCGRHRYCQAAQRARRDCAGLLPAHVRPQRPGRWHLE